MPPNVHTAMADNRPEKQTMRGLWVEEFAAAAEPSRGAPVYLTLAGAEGRDIKALADAGLIRLTESGAIEAADADKIVAIEGDEEAFLQLIGTFEGLDARRARVEHLLRSESALAWPDGREREIFRAPVVNFDFDGSLLVTVRDHQLVFPQLTWVRKVAEIQAQPPQGEWCLLLTFQGQIQWPEEVEAGVIKLLADNFANTEGFSDLAARLVGDDAFAAIADGSGEPRLSELSSRTQQCILMTLVPKKMLQLMRGHGWRIETKRNICYGGSGSRAPMVSFVFRFGWDERASTEPEVNYRECLLAAVEEPALIDSSGALGPLL
jgi:hypothetical protein